MTTGRGLRAHADLILGEIRTALDAVEPGPFDALVDALLAAPRVFVCGVGRVGLSLQALVKRLNHLGVRAWFVGDLGEPAARPGDLLLVGSGSGESVVPVAIARVARERGARVVHVGSNPAGSLAPLTDLFVRIPVRTRLARADEIASRQIMTSLFEQSLYVLGDALALEIAARKGITDVGSLWEHHANLE
jgi:6-phospho-3-hexuloisomerase